MSASPDLGFLQGPVLDVAPRLLGSVLRHGDVAVRITEVEAYDGSHDPASHAYRGETPRNSVMFGEAGRLYVYFTYGMHHCCNVVCAETGRAAAVLLRAGEVIEGLEVARGRRAGSADIDLARGPARLCRVLDIDRQHNGVDLRSGVVTLTPPRALTTSVQTGPRVGVRHGADLPWRFWAEGERSVSRYRPAAPKRSTTGH